MGACCSCHSGAPIFRGGLLVEDDVRPREIKTEVDDHGNTVLFRGDKGHLQGSSQYVSMFSQKGTKGVNQDAMTVWEGFLGDIDTFFGGVFDGHGPSGHMVSRYIRDSMPAGLSSLLCQNQGVDDNKNVHLLLLKAGLIKCFHRIDEELEADASIESYCSGTTSVTVLKKGEHLIVGNLGDSRAVLCKRNEYNQLVSEQLTVDIKPNLPDEMERITSSQGRVLSMEEEPKVYRIWMPDQDFPGLAMSRAFGDFCMKDFGLIATPDVTYRKLTDSDEFVVLASDGVWDVLSNDQVVKIVSSARTRSRSAKLIVDEAVRAWRDKFPCEKIDDCTVVCLFFKRQQASLTKSISSMLKHLEFQTTKN